MTNACLGRRFLSVHFLVRWCERCGKTGSEARRRTLTRDRGGGSPAEPATRARERVAGIAEAPERCTRYLELISQQWDNALGRLRKLVED